MKYFGLTLFSFTALWANPSAPVVMEGSGAFHEKGAVLEVTAADKTIIHWNDFSIAAGETTRFIQPDARSIVLNRVVGPLQSLIDGVLQANGRVVLVNPNGVIIGPNGVVQAADFIAATYDILNVKDWSLDETHPMENLSGAINMDGIVRATGFGEEGGKIVLIADTVAVQGALEAPQGKVDVISTQLTYLGKTSLISVDGCEGNGTGSAGEVMIWSDGSTQFDGTIYARGSRSGGDGGFVEVSGKNLGFNGFVDRQAPQGKAGMLLLDPINITISTAVDSGNVSNPGGGGGTYSFTGCIPSPANINTNNVVTGLNANLNAGPVTINTSAGAAAGCADAGTILVSDPVTWTAANKLTLIADSDITVLADIQCTAAGDISITSGGSLTIGSVGNVSTAFVETNGQIDVVAATGMSVIGGNTGANTGAASIRTLLVTSPLNITVTSGDLLISASTNVDDASVGSEMTGGFATINVLNGSLILQNNNGGHAFIGTHNALDIFAAQNIEFQSNGNGSCEIRCNSMTGNPSTIRSGVDSIFTAVGMGDYEPNFQNSIATWSVGRDMTFTSSSSNGVATVFGPGAVLNIGRDFFAASQGTNSVFIQSNVNLTVNVLGNYTIDNQGTSQTVMVASSFLDVHVLGDVLVKNTGATTMLNAVMVGLAGVSVNSSGTITLDQDGAIRALANDILVIANEDIIMGPNSAVDGLVGPGVSNITLVVDNQAPSFPAIGLGRFLMDSTASINNFGSAAVRIFTARQSQNSIAGLISGVNFSLGPFDVDTLTEHWRVYYPDPFVGPLFTVFYKEPIVLANIPAILNASTQSNGVVFDLLQEFVSPIPFYDDYFCLFYKWNNSSKNSSVPNEEKCLWISVDNYRKFYPSLSRWEYLSPANQ